MRRPETEAERRERLERERTAGVNFNRILREKLEDKTRLEDLVGRDRAAEEGGNDAP